VIVESFLARKEIGLNQVWKVCSATHRLKASWVATQRSFPI